MSEEIRVRPMLESDAECVRELDQRAFAQHLSPTTPRRSSDHIRACIRMHPRGCFIAEGDEGVGYIFSRAWGTLGWIGTFGVSADRAGAGVGQRLLRAGVAALRASGCELIGLETMPYSERNVGFYLQNGFELCEPTLVLVRQKRANDSAGREPELLDDAALLRTISDAASPGLDYSGDAVSAHRDGWGESYSIGDAKDDVFAIVRTRPPREYARINNLEVTALVSRVASTEHLDAMLGRLEALAAHRGLDGVLLSVHARQSRALHALLARGYRVKSTLLRMQIPGKNQMLRGFDLSQWAM